MTLLGVRDLRVDFRGSGSVVPAVRGISLSVEAGEVVGVVGESGSGKSAAMLALTGLLPAGARASGSVRLSGRELLGAREEDLRRVRGSQIGMVFQDALSALNPTMPVGRQLAEAAARHLHLGPRAAHDRAVELLAAVGLPDPVRRAGEYPHRWSGGMRQRALVAMALAARPRLVLADEPTSALDAELAAEIADLLLRLRAEAGTAVLVSSHDLGLIARTADRVLVMYAGRIVEGGAVEDVFLRPAHPYTAALLGALPGGLRPGESLRPIPGDPPDPSRVGPGCAFAPRCGHAMHGCLLVDPEPYRVSGDNGHLTRCWRYDPEAPPGGGVAHGAP